MKSKDLILITAYTPDTNRQELLRKLVNKINKDTFDIMISSHSFIPNDVFEKVDYFVYEKNNDLDFEIDKKFSFYYFNELFEIKTTEVKKFNHFKAVIRHISSGLIYAKKLGYNFVHYFEYDSLIEDDCELIDNSKLLNTYSAVFYSLPHLPFPNSPLSLNLNKISESWFDLDNNKYEEFLNNPSSTKLGEEYEWILLSEKEDIFKKDYNSLREKNIFVGLNEDLEDNKWIVPIYNSSDDTLSIFSWVETQQDLNSEVYVILNETHLFKLNRNYLYGWTMTQMGKKEDIQSIKIIVNNIVRRSYNFDKIDINTYIKYNYLNPTQSN